MSEPTTPVATPPAPAADAPVAETPPAAPIPPEPETATAGRFAALARKEKALKAEQAKFEAERAEVGKSREKVSLYEKALAEAKKMPLKALEALGISYEELTEAVLADGKPGASLETRAVQEEVAKLRKELTDEEEAQKSEAERVAKAQREAEISEYRTATLDFVNENAAEYELTVHFGQQEQVFEVQRLAFEKHGKSVSMKEAAELVEADLAETAKKLKGTKKFAALFADATPPASPASSSPAVAGSVQPQKQTPTLTNDLTAATATKLPPATSEKEEIARAQAVVDRMLAAKNAKK